MTHRSPVLLLEDCHWFGRALLRALALGDMIEHVASIADAARALAAYPREVFISDVRLPDGNALDLIEQLPAPPDGPDVIVLTACGDVETNLRARAAKARYSQKFSDSEEPTTVLVKILREDIESLLARRRSAEERKIEVVREISGQEGVTPRELQVCELIATGWAYAQAGEALGIAESTAENAFLAAMKKLYKRTGVSRAREFECWVLDEVAYRATRER